MAEPIVSKGTYLVTWLVLLGLTLGTVLIGFIDMGPFSMTVALVIAILQAVLIASFFMQAIFEFMLVRVTIAAGVVWVLIMMTLTLTDYITRGWLPVPGK